MMKHRKLSLIWYIFAKTFLCDFSFSLSTCFVVYSALEARGTGAAFSLLALPPGDWQVW